MEAIHAAKAAACLLIVLADQPEQTHSLCPTHLHKLILVV